MWWQKLDIEVVALYIAIYLFAGLFYTYICVRPSYLCAGACGLDIIIN